MSVNVASAPTDVLEERLIDAEYKIWKKNTPYLYDFVLTHSLEWPSLTCQWLPTIRNAGDNATEHSLLLGTHTTGEQNYLMVGSCALPRDDDVVDPTANTSASSNGNTDNNNANNAAKSKAAPQYDDEKKEVGGFGHGSSGGGGTNNVGKIEIKLKVKHQGEVNRARYMPQNHFIVASRGPSAEIYIFDLSKHPSIPSEHSPFTPQGVCVGHTKEGYGMAWSKLNEGQLLTASDDKTVRLWDVAAATANKAASVTPGGVQIQPLLTLNGHEHTVEDVDWHPMDPKLIASVGDDKIINLWDVRASSSSSGGSGSGSGAGAGVTPMHTLRDAHDGDINCVSFCPGNEHVFATGSADKTVALWDMRTLKTRLHTLSGHTDQVYKVEWAPFNESILASCSADRRVGIWDLSRIGNEQTPEDAEDGPPELLFLHGGHTSKVSDFSWNNKEEWTIASVSEDNVLQVWNLAEEIYAEEDDEELSAGAGEDGLLGDDELED